jgi:hypothetical protein
VEDGIQGFDKQNPNAGFSMTLGHGAQVEKANKFLVRYRSSNACELILTLSTHIRYFSMLEPIFYVLGKGISTTPLLKTGLIIYGWVMNSGIAPGLL